jgi:23S rRNA (guanosine2251-2'-O)-methyltransferase
MNRKLSNDELGRLSPQAFETTKKLDIIVVLDDIRSLNNVGSIFRTADAFIVSKIYLCGITGKPPHRDIQKTALGATETVEWEYQKSIQDCIQTLIKDNYQIVSIEQAENTTMLNDMKFNRDTKYALILGNEVKGVSQEVINNSNVVLEIPQEGTKHSLNVSISGGIVLWEAFRQLNS